MFEALKFARRPSAPRHLIDLDSVRDTLAYIASDTRNRPGFENLTSALCAALSEVEELQKTRNAVPRVAVLRSTFVAVDPLASQSAASPAR